MGFLGWLRRELRAVFAAFLYFAAVFLGFMALKRPFLGDHQIAFSGAATALTLALITAKVVLLLDHAPLGHRVGLVEAALRTAVCTAAALALLVLEHAVSERAAAGGVGAALRGILGHPDMPAIWAATLVPAAAFAGQAAYAVVKREVGAARLRAIFLGR